MAIDMAKFIKNRSEFPLEELAKYAGQWILWAPDGASIVASSAVSEEAAYEQLRLTGHDPAECCLSYVPGDDDVFDGPVILNRIRPPGDRPCPP